MTIPSALTVNPAVHPPDVATDFEFVRTTGEIQPAKALGTARSLSVQKDIATLNLNAPVLLAERQALLTQAESD